MENRKQISSIGARVTEGFDFDAIVKQCQAEYNQSYQAVNLQRNKFREQDKYYHSTDKSDRIDLHTIYYIVHTQLALFNADKISVEFLPRQFGGEESAKNLTKIARFDVEEMDLQAMNYHVQLNRLQRGVGIRYYKGFDRDRMCNVWDVVDTRSWVPDVMGWYRKEGFRYEGFEVLETMGSLSAYDYDNLDLLNPGMDSESKETIDNDRRNGNINTVNSDKVANVDESNSIYGIYHHYTTFRGARYHVVLGNNRTVVLAVEQLLPVYDNEKKDLTKVPFPTVHNYLSPKPNTPYGVSLIDLILTNHKYKNMLAHLGFIREKEAALGPDILVNNKIIRDHSIFNIPSLEKRFIPVNGAAGPLSNAAFEMPATRMPASNYNYMELIDRNIEAVTGVDSRQAGINPSRASTLGESNQIQANNNLRSLLSIETNNVGEAEFWKLNIRYYRMHFTDADQKLIRVANSYGTQLVVFTRKDFISAVDPDVRIVSRAQADSERVRKLTNLSAYLTAKMVDPNATQLARSEAERKYLELAGVDRDEAVAIYAPLSYEEREALILVELLNANDPLGAEITNMEVDHNIYISIFERAINTPAKLSAIKKRQDAVIEMGQNKKAEMDANRQNQISSMAQAQMLNRGIQGSGSDAVSRADLTGGM